MTTDHGGTIPHAQQVPDWRTLTPNGRCHDTIIEGDTVGVLMSNCPVRAWVERADYERIVAAYGTTRWHWNGRRGSVSILLLNPRRLINVARLVAGGEAKGFVQYGDDNRLNLRRANLSVDAAKRPRRDGLSKVRAEKAAEVERGRAERRALRAEKAAASAAAPPVRKRVSKAPTVRPFVPPPPLAIRPQVAPPVVRVAPRVVKAVVPAVRRSGLPMRPA